MTVLTLMMLELPSTCDVADHSLLGKLSFSLFFPIISFHFSPLFLATGHQSYLTAILLSVLES